MSSEHSGQRRYMRCVIRLFTKRRISIKGQTMTEYALMLAAVAVVAYVTYQVMGQDIGSMVNTIDNALSTS